MTTNFPYKWEIETGYPSEKNGYSVFSCFAGGGGSSMGYKLAGYEVVGCNEIDKRALKCYKKNLNPKHCFDIPIQELKKQKKLPEKLFHLDILDGSPPCTSFSMAGNKEKDWGKKRKYSEGQFEQVLDTLFFDYIELAERLQSKIVVSENVQSMLWGRTNTYVKKVCEEFKKAGYITTYSLLDASKMGVPQKRIRLFFFSIRKDLIDKIRTKGFLKLPYLDLEFDEKPITFKEATENLEVTREGTELTPLYQKYWKQARQGEQVGKQDTPRKIILNEVSRALTTGNHFHPIEMRKLAHEEYAIVSSFPQDYDYCGFSAANCRHILGMSVPPIMMAQVAKQVQLQWLNKIYEAKRKRRRKQK